MYILPVIIGVNGAGKSTTMSILTGDTDATSGAAYLNGFPLADPRTKLSIGYCPQVDPLLDLMNRCLYATILLYRV